jgi:hypothetical protein
MFRFNLRDVSTEEVTYESDRKDRMKYAVHGKNTEGRREFDKEQ